MSRRDVNVQCSHCEIIHSLAVAQIDTVVNCSHCQQKFTAKVYKDQDLRFVGTGMLNNKIEPTSEQVVKADHNKAYLSLCVVLTLALISSLLFLL